MTAREDFERLLAPIAALAAQAGTRVLEIAARGAPPRTKADHSPVTAADEAAEEIIMDGLRRILPGVPIIAEEAAARGEIAECENLYFLVDPIDGTREFIAGRDEYTVNIGLIADGRPVLGVIGAPALGRVYLGAGARALRAVVSAGRFDMARAEPIRARPRPAQLTALVSRSHPDAKSGEYLAHLPVAERLPLGSSLKFTCIAEGRGDVYARLAPISEWDIAAGHGLLAAAGGRLTRPDGNEMIYGTRKPDFSTEGFVAWGAPA